MKKEAEIVWDRWAEASASMESIRERLLDKCDAALADKPNLAAVFDEPWRREFRRRARALSLNESPRYPPAYGAPALAEIHGETYFPSDFQQRMEEGLSILRGKLGTKQWRDLVSRLRERDGVAAEDEVLAVRGFAREFGEVSIVLPDSPPDARKPEFEVSACGVRFAVECRALFDQEGVRELNTDMSTTGQPWVGYIPQEIDQKRLRRAIVQKIHRRQSRWPTLFVLSQYTAWLIPPEVAELFAQILANPTEFDITDEQAPLALAHTAFRIVQGVWINQEVASRHGINENICDRVLSAVSQSFWPRADQP